ncbi:divergent polysaccharide deacetylase family protein [Sedimentitalea sp. JM2-8]|uniref:Divergent polysaccharide deacetylase family protein n=1 Tax=Sedimentitalea xiamensis TaxID=3050037 RepID=A0ABT7FBI2_9RHOB|nr:divergent polysaccharide deacetylase family protein [Sedimentitalea xiamensis]MDK3072476.1 divergent polysaccharide deacetylase family protein [Sedimentitalea xiamensis]
MRGFLGGIVSGLALAAIGVAALSVLSPAGPPPTVAPDVPEQSAGDAAPGTRLTLNGAPTDPEVVETARPAAVAAPLETDDPVVAQTQAIPDRDLPQVGVSPAPLDAPKGAAQSPAVPAGVESAALTGTAAPPRAPEKDKGIIVVTGVPAVPALAGNIEPVVAKDGSTLRSVRYPEPEIEPAARSETPSLTLPGADSSPGVQPGAAPPTVDPAPDQVAAVDSNPDADLRNGSPDQTPAPNASQITPGFGTPVVPLTERAKNPDLPADASKPDQRPLDQFAAAFDNPDDLPLLAIVLVDDADAADIEALDDFPYPLGFAIDPAAPDAAGKMTRHRAAGSEVLALVDLPPAATARDAEVVLAAGFDVLSEAVAVIEGPGTGLQGNRALSGQVSDFARGTGRGLVTQSAGLNAAHKQALRDGVPSALVWRDLDRDGPSPDSMRRGLDQAAFRAVQEGGIVVMARLRPDTVKALLLWAGQTRPGRVAVAPVSAVMKQSLRGD